MTTVAELTSICTEFQQNFSNLSIRYGTLQQELQAEKEQRAKLQRQLEESQVAVERSANHVKECKIEVEELKQYKDKYFATTVTVEHLKGRLETARRGVADSVVEHDQLTEQLRAQNRDLLQRIEVSSDAQQMASLRNQCREIEERAALLSGQLIEEKERHHQQQLTAHSALRELQARNLELEQRYRQMESEVTQMRSTVRRSLDLQNECALQREKAIMDATRTQTEASAVKKQLQDIQEKLNALRVKHDEEMELIRVAFEEERQGLLQRVASAVSERNDAVAARESEVEKVASLQRSMHKKVSLTRDEVALELESLHKQHGEDREELMRVNTRAKLLEQQLGEMRRTLAHLEAKAAQLESDKVQLRSQTEQAIQQESWYAAEKDHLLAQAQQMKTRLDELTVVAKQHEALSSEVDRLRLQLQYKDGEVQEMKRIADHAVMQVRQLEETCDKRCMAMHKQTKALKKQFHAEILKNDTQRKSLMASLMQKEKQLQHLLSAPNKAVNGGALPQAAIGAAVSAFSRDAVSGGFDPMSLIQPLSEQATNLETRLASLSRKSPSNSSPHQSS